MNYVIMKQNIIIYIFIKRWFRNLPFVYPEYIIDTYSKIRYKINNKKQFLKFLEYLK